jgi:hypothetical protein
MEDIMSEKVAEPFFTPLNSDRISLINGLNFYSREFDFSDSKRWAISWLKKKQPELAKKLTEVKDAFFNNRGFVCRMNERGYVLSSEQETNLLKFFENLVLAEQEEQEIVEKDSGSKVKVPAMKINPCLQSLNEVIDAVLEGKNPPALQLSDKKADVQEVVDYCVRTIEEMTEYGEYYSPQTIRALMPVLKKCCEQGLTILKSLENKKTSFVAPKKINPSAMVKGVRYQKEDKALGIKSVPITSVIGSRKLYAYDTKARKIRLYVSNSAQGFMFSGTTLKNFDPEKSVCKTVRKPEQFFAQFSGNITMSALNKSFKELSTTESKIESGGRFNENLIILKVASE